MAALANKRREAFCQFVVGNVDKPRTLTQAYRQAGYSDRGRTATTGGSRLMTYADIKERVAELSEPAIVETGLSIERLLVEIERTLRDAREDRAHGACVAALGLVLRVHELIAAQGAAEPQFAGASTTAEIMQMLIDQAGGPREAIELAGQMIDAAQAQLANQAILVG